MAPCPTSGLIIQGGQDEIVVPQTVTALAKRLNTQRNVCVDFAMVEEADHMYNGHLTDLYKIVGNYVINAVNKKKPLKKRRGRRRKDEMEDASAEDIALLTDESDDFPDGDDEL